MSETSNNGTDNNSNNPHKTRQVVAPKEGKKEIGGRYSRCSRAPCWSVIDNKRDIGRGRGARSQVRGLDAPRREAHIYVMVMMMLIVMDDSDAR